MRENLKKIIKTRMGLFYGVLIASTLLLSLSYSIFVIYSNRYNASDMLIGNLMYGISIEDEEGNSLSSVTSNANTTKYYYVTVYSINSVNSKYTLAYKPVSDNNGLTVTASNRSGWNASGSIKNYENYAYKRTIKVEVKNESNTNKTLTFKAFGGYTYSTIANINIGSGYYLVINGTIEINGSQKNLSDIVEEDTNCTPTSSNPCLYGGEAESNYLKFNGSSDLYRVLGNYKLGEDTTTKIAAVNLTDTTLKENIGTSLTNYYSNLNNDYIYTTNKFNCTSSGCTTSSYNNIGLLTKYEYNLLDGVNSYLNINESYYILEDNTVKQLNNDGTTTDASSSKLRPVVYLTEDAKVTGTGTVNDPYILAEKSDITILAYTYNGESTSNLSTFISGLGSSYVAEVTCSNGTVASFNSNGNLEFTTLNLPTACTIDFRDKYTVAFTASGTGTVSESSKDILYGKTVNVTATPNTGSYLSSASCTNGYTTNATTGTSATAAQNVTVSNNNVKNGSTCTFTFGAKTYDVTGATNNSSYGTVTSSTIAYGGTTTLTVTPKSGYYLKTFSCTGGYTHNATTGGGASGSQNVTINNANHDNASTCTATFEEKTGIEMIMAGLSRGTRNNFNTSFSTNGSTLNYTAGVYETTSTLDGSTVYYYSGNVQNNWVRFGNKGSTCYYWRIIRTNTVSEGGGIRLLYAGSSTSCTGSVPVMTNAYINGTTYYYATSNGLYNNPAYSGYMYTASSQYGHNTSSYVKTQVESWYTSSGLSNFASKINSNAIYCADRTIGSGSWNTGSTAFYYSAYSRLTPSTPTPTLACSQSADKFSKGTGGGGNGYLSQPIALMTADEIAFAGGKYGNNSYSYYYYASDNSSSATGSTYWWTMSPYYWGGSYAGVFRVYGSNYPGYLDGNYVRYSYGVRPVVSLVSSTSFTGTGTVSDPYVIN